MRTQTLGPSASAFGRAEQRQLASECVRKRHQGGEHQEEWTLSFSQTPPSSLPMVLCQSPVSRLPAFGSLEDQASFSQNPHLVRIFLPAAACNGSPVDSGGAQIRRWFRAWSPLVPHLVPAGSAPGPRWFHAWSPLVPRLVPAGSAPGPRWFSTWSPLVPRLVPAGSAPGPRWFRGWSPLVPPLPRAVCLPTHGPRAPGRVEQHVLPTRRPLLPSYHALSENRQVQRDGRRALWRDTSCQHAASSVVTICAHPHSENIRVVLHGGVNTVALDTCIGSHCQKRFTYQTRADVQRISSRLPA